MCVTRLIQHIFSCGILGTVYREKKKKFKSHTSDNICPEHVLISGDNLHPTVGFVGMKLGPTTFLNMVSESRLRSSGPPAIRFLLSGHPPFIHIGQYMT